MALKGLRFVYANETAEGQRLDEARVKDMTGGDTLTGRAPYGKAAITFDPTHKLGIVGNHKPEILDGSHGMWRRVALVLFGVTIPEAARDEKLLDTLKGEGSGVLNFALAGLRSYLKGGLQVPDAIKAATQAYQDDQDVIAEWKQDHCIVGAGRTCPKADAYRAYRSWAQANGHGVLSQKRFTRRLTGPATGVVRLPDHRTLGGIELNIDGQSAAARIL